MRKIEVNLYQFDELSEAVQQKVLEWGRENIEFGWNTEYRQSLKAIEESFYGLRVKNWEVSPYGSPSYTADVPQSAIRGVKLQDFPRDYMPTGFCGDCAFWGTYHDTFKRTGDAKAAIDAGLWEFFRAWRDDWGDHLSDATMSENIRANEYEFTEDGNRA